MAIEATNPTIGFPIISMRQQGRIFFDQGFSQGESRSLTTMVGTQRLTFRVTRGPDTPVGGSAEHFKINWTVAISPAG
jgi:hypothetical protein